MKNVMMLVVGVMLTLFLTAFVAKAAGAPQYALPLAGVVLAGSLVPRGKGLAFYAVSTDLSQIMKYTTQNVRFLIRRFYNSLAIANDITLVSNVKTSIPLPLLYVEGQARPYDGNFAPGAGDVNYGHRELIVGDFQRDILLDPHQFRLTYLAGFRGAGEGATNQNIPFAQYTNQAVIDQLAAQLNNTAAFFGLGKSAFTAYSDTKAYAVGEKISYKVKDGSIHYYTVKTATAAGDTPEGAAAKFTLADNLAIMEGLGTKMFADRTASVLKHVAATGAPTATDAFKQAISVFRTLPLHVRQNYNDVSLYAAPDVVDMIGDSFGDNIQKYTSADGKLSVLPRTDGRCKIVSASWMAGSKAMVVSPKQNLYLGTDLLSDLADINVVKDVYKIKYGMKGVIGSNYGDPDAIAISDQN